MYKLEGKAAPKSVAVDHLFDKIFAEYARDAGDGGSYDKFLREALGIERRSQAGQAVTRTMFLVKALNADIVDLAPYEDDPEAYWRAQMDWLREKTRGLMSLYRQMLGEIRRLGVDTKKLERYLEEEIWPDVSLATTGGPDAEVFRVLRAFDEEPR